MSDTTTIATKLADLRLFQDVLIASGQKLMSETDDATIRERLEKMVSTDQENVGRIEQSIAKLGNRVEPRDITQMHAEKVQEMMNGSQLTAYDKFFQYELLKHQQTMTGLVLHKAAQTLSSDLQDAMEPLNQVNFENRAHQEVLKGVLYFVGTREMTGQEPDMGLLASFEQAVAAIKGVVGSAIS
jgi:hypothetical protein